MGVTDTAAGAGLGVLRIVHMGDEHLPDKADLPAIGHLATLHGGASVYTIRKPLTTLGRGLQNDVVLTDLAISREHARLLWEDGRWIVENASAHNALWVGASEVSPFAAQPLPPGSYLRLGQTTLQLLAPAPDALVSGGDAAGPSASVTGITAPSLFDLGVTIQFAFSGRLARRARWFALTLGALIFLASALVTLGTAALVGETTLSTRGVGAVLAAITIPLIPALGAACLVAFIDRYEREPVVVLVGAFAWGALIAIPAALFIERAWGAWLRATLESSAPGAGTLPLLVHSALQGLSAGLAEESVKGAGLLVLLLVLRDEFDNVTDGILYGVLIGAGFAMVENFVYFASSPPPDLGFLILGRVVLGWLGHSTFTALTGAGLGYARETRDRRRQVLAPALGFLAAFLLHSFFDFVDFQANAVAHLPHISYSVASLALAAVLADYLLLFAAQAVLLHMVLRALRREQAIVREFLASEVPIGVVTPDEYAMLQQHQRRAKIEHYYLFIWGPRAYLAARGLHQNAIGLAFRKWHVAMGDRPKLTPRQPEDVYRERIPRLRRRLLRLTSQTPPGARSAESRA
ncbi:MAG TPA: PrsW family glutamic-type intramembrane protease [Ktedonobacterales bacterium]